MDLQQGYSLADIEVDIVNFDTQLTRLNCFQVCVPARLDRIGPAWMRHCDCSAFTFPRTAACVLCRPAPPSDVRVIAWLTAVLPVLRYCA